MVKATDHVKLLGVLLDQRLTFEKHLEQVKKRTTKRLQAIKALGGHNWGLSLKELRLIYNACIAPIALYAASVWHVPKVRGRLILHREQVKALTAIQRHAAKTITGGFRLVSGDAYNAELHLLPMNRRLHQLRMQALARIATSPAYARIRPPSKTSDTKSGTMVDPGTWQHLLLTLSTCGKRLSLC